MTYTPYTVTVTRALRKHTSRNRAGSRTYHYVVRRISTERGRERKNGICISYTWSRRVLVVCPSTCRRVPRTMHIATRPPTGEHRSQREYNIVIVIGRDSPRSWITLRGPTIHQRSLTRFIYLVHGSTKILGKIDKRQPSGIFFSTVS